MSVGKESPVASGSATPVRNAPPQPIIIQQPGGIFGRFKIWLLTTLLMSSLIANLVMYVDYNEYFASAEGPREQFHSGERHAPEKLAIIRVTGVIMPPFSERVIKAIKAATEDKTVKGVLLAVDSPGGTVTDSHKIYHWLKKLSAKKPVVVSMGSYAASGGYFVAMGAGKDAKIFAEPTTATGSIGVIIERYDLTELAEKAGVKWTPLTTGEFKGGLHPLRHMSDRDQKLWENILNQGFELFLQVIDENRDKLDKEQVRELATGQIYTARDAKENGLIDEIGFQEDAIEALQKIAGLSKARVITYQFPGGLLDTILGSAKASDPSAQIRSILEMATLPRAMYYCSWGMPLAPAAE